MNLLLDELPCEVIDINGTLYFDTDIISDEDDEFVKSIEEKYKNEVNIELTLEEYKKINGIINYKFKTNYREVIEIMMMYENAILSEYDKAYCMLMMFYIDEIPEDIDQAFNKAIEFLNCGEEKEIKNTKTKKRDYGRLWSFGQDGSYIFSAINYSHNDILIKNPDLHWIDWNNRFLQLKEECRFCEIVNNRLAHKMKKATKDQQMARKEFPEIYVLKEERKIDDEKLRKLKEMQDKLNS